MKKLPALIAFAALFFAKSSFAQRNEFDASINVGNATIVSNGGFEEFWNGNNFVSKSFSPSYFLSVRHFFSNRFGLGLTFGYFADHGDYSYFERSDEYYRGSTYTRSSYIIAPEITIGYLTQPGLKLYMLVAMGARISSANIDISGNTSYGRPEPNVIIPALQYTPIGVRFGSGIGGFAELGWGYKGIINAGFFMKF
ncbi:MAG: hypothetical protein ACTHJ0_02175 [Flavipsychrobacter sp.]